MIFSGALLGLYNIVRSLFCEPGRVRMKMTPVAVVVGSLLILAAIVFVVVILPLAIPADDAPSEIFRTRSAEEAAGRKIYIANGCVYCHSQSIRTIDWGLGAERIAQAGDYVADHPILLGSAAHRAGSVPGRRRASRRLAYGPFHEPALSPGPSPLMPAFEFLGMDQIGPL